MSDQAIRQVIESAIYVESCAVDGPYEDNDIRITLTVRQARRLLAALAASERPLVTGAQGRAGYDETGAAADVSRLGAALAAPPDRQEQPMEQLKRLHRYTITSEGASLGYFRLVEDAAGAWVTWAEVEAMLRWPKMFAAPVPQGERAQERCPHNCTNCKCIEAIQTIDAVGKRMMEKHRKSLERLADPTPEQETE